jgi:S-formylglutathione hydrolase FrmB
MRSTGLAVFLAFLLPASAQEKPSPDLPAAGTIKDGRFRSEALGRDMEYQVYLPPGYGKTKDRYPVVYFLHGLIQGHTAWARRGCNDVLDFLIARGKAVEMVIALPEGGNSFYTNAMNGGGRYEDYIVQDFIPHIEKTFRVQDRREGRALSGDSAGGYGALKIAWKHPKLFCAVATHSAVLLPSKISEMSPRIRNMAKNQFFGKIFGDPFDESFWARENPMTLAKEKAGEIKGLRIYFDCGEGDRYGFAEGTELLHQALKGAGVEHEYALLPGDHGREYIKVHIDRSLVFASDTFRAAGGGGK